MATERINVNQPFEMQITAAHAQLIREAARNAIYEGLTDPIGRKLFPEELTIVYEEDTIITPEQYRQAEQGIYGQIAAKFPDQKEILPDPFPVRFNAKEMMALLRAFTVKCYLHLIDISELLVGEQIRVKEYFTAYDETLGMFHAVGGPELPGLRKEVKDILMYNRFWAGEYQEGDEIRYI